jgi:hypothetical protein
MCSSQSPIAPAATVLAPSRDYLQRGDARRHSRVNCGLVVRDAGRGGIHYGQRSRQAWAHLVDVVGEIVAADEQAFEQKVAILHSHADEVIVTLSGPGSAALPAMKIGELIHENGWATYVSSGNPCTSSCSIIWLAGAPRTIEGAPVCMSSLRPTAHQRLLAIAKMF